jgi:hypothetical protein
VSDASSAGEPFVWATPVPQAIQAAFERSKASSAAAGADWGDYGETLMERFIGNVAETTLPFARMLGVNVDWLSRAVLFLAAAIVILLLARVLLSVWRNRVPAPALPRAPMRPAPAPARSASQRKAEAERFLANGDPRQALTSMWWWFAERALQTTPEAMMTTNDVLVRSRRADLRQRAQTLDRLRFGGTPPSSAEARALLASFESVL